VSRAAAPTGAQGIRDTYSAGLQQVGAVLGSIKATRADREAAQQTLDDLTAMMLAHTIETVQGRTALLTGLIVELTAVIARIEERPPFLSIANNLTQIVSQASALLELEKKDLV
jgi:hypothetical protein